MCNTDRDTIIEPCDLEAEQKVLASLLFNPDNRNVVSMILDSDDFGDRTLGRLYSKILKTSVKVDTLFEMDLSSYYKRLEEMGEYELARAAEKLLDVNYSLVTLSSLLNLVLYIHDLSMMRGPVGSADCDPALESWILS